MTRYHPRKTKKCPKSHKTMFKKQKQASYAMMRTWAHDSRMNVYEYHTYLCPDCGHWHFGNRVMFEKFVQGAGNELESQARS